MKVCSKCREEKPEEEFHGKTAAPDGKASQCKPCSLETNKAWRAANPERHYANQRRIQLWRMYKITPEQYDAMLESQGSRCAICRNRPRKQILSVDHNHSTGEVRGLLCAFCNRKLLGGARDNPTIVGNALMYLLNPPARAVLGDPNERGDVA